MYPQQSTICLHSFDKCISRKAWEINLCRGFLYVDNFGGFLYGVNFNSLWCQITFGYLRLKICKHLPIKRALIYMFQIVKLLILKRVNERLQYWCWKTLLSEVYQKKMLNRQFIMFLLILSLPTFRLMNQLFFTSRPLIVYFNEWEL